MIWKILTAIVSAIFRALAGRWFGTKDPEKEILYADLDAKQKDSDALAAPPRTDDELDRIVQFHSPNPH